MICIFELSVCCGCSPYWELISLINSNNKDTINKIIKNHCNNSNIHNNISEENIDEHIHYGKRNDNILIKDYEFNYWFVVEEVDVID